MKIAPAFESAKRIVLLALGLLMLVLALIGAFLPVMPTTIFVILAAGFFARSSPALERRLLDHPRFGPALRGWREHGAIPRRAKVAAVAGIAFGYGVFFLASAPGAVLALTVAAAMATVAIWIVTRPEGKNPSHDRPAR
ncbi:YbaN family protein [Nitratireductor sp. GISD-1A_MAKvit]|uniref:YbaN family protein n=1 Tax=Nitratireductor sp. GISD-1A_MAKvit TaxID=3234198 RepID=UPI00346679C3